MDLGRAEQWIDRWDAQQEWYMPDREERFTVLIDAVEAGVGRDDPLVLDLGCGPGSLSVRLLNQIPAASVVAIDADPLLLQLGRREEARAAFDQAIVLARTPAEAEHIREQLDRLIRQA